MKTKAAPEMQKTTPAVGLLSGFGYVIDVVLTMSAIDPFGMKIRVLRELWMETGLRKVNLNLVFLHGERKQSINALSLKFTEIQ
jgi:hypothetical protein